MRKEIKKAPTIRFRGFTDDWEQRKIADVAEIITGGTPSTRIVEYWNPPEVPWLSSGEVHKKYITSTDTMISRKGYENSSATMVRENSVLIALAGQGKTRGTVAINRIPLSTNQSIAAMTFSDDIDSDYVFSNLENRYEELRSISSGDGSRGGLNKKLVGDVTIPCPTLLEQNAIGTLFRVLNELITLHQRKLEQQKNLKKYFLQNMFPAKGEKVPRIRFKGFTGDWEQRKLGELVIIERGGSPRPIDAYITEAQDGLNWVKIGDAPEQGRYITHTKEKIKPSGLSKTRQVFPGDLILSNSMSFGKPYIMGITGCIHDGWLLIRNNQNVFDLKFLCQMLGTKQMLVQYRRLAAGSTVNNLNKELVANAIVKVPETTEQEQIGAFLENLDNVITLHQRKLNQLLTMKKFMLQNLFI